MANIKSAIKRVKLSEESRLQNASFKSDIRTSVKKAEMALAEKDVEAATQLVAEASSKLDKAVSKKIIHKNTATRYKSRLMTNLNAVKA